MTTDAEGSATPRPDFDLPGDTGRGFARRL